MSDAIGHLLKDIFNHDFSALPGAEAFHRQFFGHPLSLQDLGRISAFVCQHSIDTGQKEVHSAVMIPGKGHGKPLAILAQLHGNEPAGLAGIALAMALSQAGRLASDIVAVIGNPLAAAQYFAALKRDPGARQEARDAYRCGLTPEGALLPDMNRIPVDFMQRNPAVPHIARAQELFALGHYVSGIVDIHSARGNMVCITDHKHDCDLKDSPIRNILTELAEAISANASASVTVQTLKTILGPLSNIKTQTGIEAGRHESAEAPKIAASFTLSLLHTLGLTDVSPLYKEENGIFNRYAVKPRLTYGDLVCEGTLAANDKIYMARPARMGEKPLIIGHDGERFVAHQYEEMESIKEGQVVAVAVPSGTLFKAPRDFSTLFISKSSALYDKDPAVGPWPVDAADIGKIKFCYPCDVSAMPLKL